MAKQLAARAAHLHLPARVFVEGDNIEIDVSGHALTLEEKNKLTRVNPAGEQPLPLVLKILIDQDWTRLNPPAGGTLQVCPTTSAGPVLRVSGISPSIDLRAATVTLQQSSAEVWVVGTDSTTSDTLMLRFPGMPSGDWTDRSTPMGAVVKDVIAAIGAPTSQISSSLFRQVC